MRALRWDMRARMLHLLQIYVAKYVADMLFKYVVFFDFLIF